MASIKERYIYIPHYGASYQKVVGEYTSRGFPGCIGSVDCGHIGGTVVLSNIQTCLKVKSGSRRLHMRQSVSAANSYRVCRLTILEPVTISTSLVLTIR
jgi:hypothetical protein